MKVTRRTGSLVIVLVIFAAIVLGTALAAFAIDKSEIPMLQQHAAEAAVTADGYTHGSNIGRQTSGNAVSNESQLVSALNSNGTYYLTSNITLTAGSGGAFSNTRSFSGTLYGNGHTVTIEYSNGSAVKNANQNEGGLVSTLTGRIYDLNVVLSNTTIKRGRETTSSWPSSPPPSTYNMGIIAGYINGGTVENCTVTINSGVTIWAFSWRSNDWASFGTIAGRAANNANITNCTTVNNGEIKAGAASNTSVSDVSIASENSGSASNLVGFYEAGNYTIDNIIVSGNGYLRAFVSSPLGLLSTAGISIHMTNFYDKTTNSKIINGNSYWSYTFLKWTGSPDVTISNLYRYGDTQHDMNAGITPGAEVKINRSSTYSIYFDPKATDTSESLVVVKSGVTGGANYSATITGASNNSYSDHYAFNSTGDTVVFRNLPTAASNWSSGGNFTCDINITQDQIEVPTMDPLNKWEHGYVADDTTTSGTEAISTGTQFENIFRPNGSLNQSGTYYLNNDIAITGFTGKTFGGTLDGNGHTIFITGTHTGMTGPHIGGLVGTLSGTIKNVRVVLMLPNNTQVTCTNGKGGDDFVIGFGGVVGKINGGTVENVNVVIPSGYTFSAGWSGNGSDVGVGGIAGSMIGSGTVTNCTVQVDGDIRASSGWPFASGIVGATGKEQSYSDYPFRFTNIILKGIGTIGGTTGSGNDTQPTFAAAITITPPITGKTISIDGFIYNMTGENGPTWGSGGGAGSGYGKVSSWGYVCQNDDDGRLEAGVGLSAGVIISYSNIYDMGSLMYDTVAENGFTSGGDLIWYDTTNHDGNVYYNMTRTAEIKSTVADSTIHVTPYFPASSNGNLVLVAGDGTVTVPDLRYTNNAGTAFNSTADGNYKVVTVAKANVDTATVTLEEPVTPAKPIADLNQWENGYVASRQPGNVSTAAELTAAIEDNGNIILSKDIKDFVGFTHTSTFSGTLDGNGHTIYIVRDGGASGTNIGGLFSTLTGTVKNLRLVITTGADRSNTKYLGGIAGALDESAIVENVFVSIPAGVNLVTTRSGRDVGGVGGIAGGLINGSGDTVSISNTTVELQGTLKATAYWTFVGGFVGHLNGVSGTDKGAINYTNTTFKGSGLLDGVANSGEGVHTAALGIVGGNVSAVNVDGVINSFNGTLSSGRSAYAILVRNNLSLTLGNGITLTNVYTSGTVTTYNGEMTYGKPVNPSDGIKVISTTVSGDSIPVTPYFPASSNGNLVLVAGNGSESVTTPLAYNNGTDSFVSEAVTVGSAKYQVVTVAKENVTTDPVSLEIAAVNDPVIATPSEDLVYKGQNGIDVTIGTLKYGSDVLELGKDYTITIAAVAGGSVMDNKPVNAGEYTLTVTLTNHKFADDSTEKVLNFIVSPKAVTVTVTAPDHVYDGSDQIDLEGVIDEGDVFEGDNVSLVLPKGIARISDVEQNINVTVDTITLSGTDAANYTIANQPGTVTVNIIAKELTFTAGTTSFLFADADTTRTAITDQNLTAGNTYSVNVTGFVEADPPEDKAYTLTVADPSYITERTADGDGSKFLTVGKYTVTLSPVSKNYTFDSNNNTFTFEVTINENANTWITEYARDGWTYYSDPSAVTEPVARFGSPAITYSNGNEGFSNTTAQGTYKVNVSVAETGNYGALTEEYSFTVSALDVTVALSAADTTYDGQDYEASNILITLTATVNKKETTYTSANNTSDVSTLLGSYDWQQSVDGGETETKEEGLPTNAGTYTLYICNYSSNKNVNVTGTLNCTVTISPAEVKFSAAIKGDAKLVYGTVPTDFNSLVTVTASGGIDLSAENWSFTVKPSVENDEYTAKTSAGKTVTLTVQVSVKDPNYTAVQPTKQPTLVIQKADIGKISVTNFVEVTIGYTTYKGFVYGQAEPLAFSGIPADLTVDPVYTYAVQGGAQINNFDISKANYGIYTVAVSITGDTNYNDKTEAIVFAIAQANRSVTVSIVGWTYGEEANPLQIDGIEESVTTTVSYSGTTNADTNNLYGPTDVVPTEAGTYTVTVSWDETTNYTAGSVKSAEFTIAKATGFANISVNGTQYTEKVTAYYTGSAQPFKVTVEGHGGEIKINGTPLPSDTDTMDYNLRDVGRTEVEVTVAQTANYLEAPATAIIEILPAVIQSVTLGTTKFTFGTLNTENANDAATYGTPGVTFVNGKGSPEFTYSLAYSKTEKGNDEITYISFGTYTLTMKLTGETATNFVFDGGTATVQVTKGENTWTDKSEIKDFTFGFNGEEVKGKAAFGNVAIDYYIGDVTGKADKGSPITSFSFAAQGVSAGTYTAVVSVPANNNYDGISYEYIFVVKKHRLNITELKISGTEDTEISGSATDGFTVTYAPDMGLSATVKVGSAEGYAGNYSDLLGKQDTRTYLFEHSVADSNVWDDGLPENAGKYTVRFKGMKLAAGYNINNFAFVYEGNETELTTKLTINKATVSASAELKGDIVYGMTVAKIKELVSVSEGVSMTDVAVTYINESGESVGYSETTQSGTKLTITVTVEAEDDNYTVDSDTVKLEKTVQKAKLTVTAEGGSAHSATFVPDNFKAFDRVEAKWGENPVEASEYPKYLFIELTGYSGEVAGDPETNFGNGEIGVYTFTVKLTDEAAKNFLMVDAAGAEYEGELTFTYTLATEKVTLTVKLEGWTYGDAPNDPTFTVKDADGNSIGMQTIGHYISVKYEGINGTEYDFATAPTEAGDYIITAAITGHTDYVAEEEATKEFTIGKRPIALVLSSDSASEYYDRRVAITDFTSVFGEYFVADDNSYAYEHALKDVFTLTASSDSGDVTEIKNAGSYKITAKLINDNYVWATDATSPEFIYKIDKAIVTIQMAYKEANIYDGEPVDAPVLSLLELPNGEKYGTKDQFTDVKALIKDDEELMAILRAITVKYGIGETPIDAGEYTFNANYPENDNYKAAEYQGLFTIGKAYIGEFSIEVPSHSYTGEILAGQTPVLTGENAQLANEGLSETVSYFVWNGTEYESVETATNVGQYKIVRTSPESNNYHEATAECEFTISPATVTINDYTASYDFGFIAAELKDEYPYVIALTASVSADSADEITYSTELIGDYGSEQGYLNVGSYTLKIVLTNGNYAFTEGAGEIAIEIVPSENKFVSVTKRDRWIYGNKPADINVSVAYGSANIVTYDSERNVVELSAATYAGNYYDVVTVPASEFGNYESIEYAGDTSFVIEKAAFVWSWNFVPDEIVYGDSLDNAFEINTPELIVESDLGYFAFNIYAYYIVDGDIVPYTVTTDANNEITLSAECVWTYDAPEGVKNSYIISTVNADPIKKTVQRKPIVITASNTTAVYGSAYIPTGDAADYFGALFTYNGEPVTALAALGSTAEFTVAGDGVAEDRLNVGNYTVTLQLSGNHTVTGAEGDAVAGADAVTINYTVAPKELHVSEAVRNTVLEFGDIALADLNSPEAVIKLIGGVGRVFDGLEFGDVLSESDLILKAADDYSDLVSDGYLSVADVPYLVSVALSDGIENYVAPSAGFGYVGFVVEKAVNRIGEYSVSGWTYLDVLSEYIPSALPSARFGVVEYGFFAPDGSEMTMDKFNSETPAGTYSFRFSVQGTDNYDSAVLTGEFVVDKRIVVAELTATDVTYDGAVYDGISYTLSSDVSDYIGTVGYEYSENGSAFRKGLPTDAGNYSVRIGEYSDSDNIELRAETVDFQINPAPMHFTVTGVDGASVEYGTAIDDIDMNALIVSVIPDSYVGGFDFTVSLITANGTAYRPGLYAGTTLYATIDITLDSNNYYPVVDTAIEMLPKVNITKVSHDMAFEISDEIITDGSSAAVIEGSANTVIDAISYYMAINDIQYYEYHITVDGEEYSRNFVWAPGTHTVEVRLSGNHEGAAQFTVVIEENPDAVDRAPFTPKTVVGEVLESINFTWASAVSIAFGVAVAVLIILFFGLRRAKRK